MGKAPNAMPEAEVDRLAVCETMNAADHVRDRTLRIGQLKIALRCRSLKFSEFLDPRP
jgi:hypothetical protein